MEWREKGRGMKSRGEDRCHPSDKVAIGGRESRTSARDDVVCGQRGRGRDRLGDERRIAST